MFAVCAGSHKNMADTEGGGLGKKYFKMQNPYNPLSHKL
jgi:hypothetical protein